MNPDDLRKADAIEVVVGQGAKPGGGGMLLGQKINKRVAGMRTLPEGIDQRSACRHPGAYTHFFDQFLLVKFSFQLLFY